MVINTSYDLPLYKEVFGNYLVIPCDNCRKVIELTKAFNNEKVKSLHTYDVKGLIDHDFLADIEKDSYLKQNIYIGCVRSGELISHRTFD